MNNCVCGRLASNSCAACLLINYCSKDCQRADWPLHRGVCRKNVIYNETIKTALSLIMGSLHIYIAHMWSSTGFILVNITETIEQFSQGKGYMHFAHIEFIKNNETCAGEIIVKCQLENYTYSISLDLTAQYLDTLRTKYCAPEPLWSVVFHL